MTGSAPRGIRSDVDRMDAAWWIDQLARVVVFVGGISAIVLIIAIFVFIASQGLGFALSELDWIEFLSSMRWRPTSENNPTYGALALIAGTASVTGLAMVVAVPFSLGAAIFIAEFATGKLREGMELLLRYAFRRLRLHRIEANIQPDNAASVALARCSGFRLEGFSPRYLKIGGRWRDHERWAMTVEDWRDRASGTRPAPSARR